jgi:cytochrome c-type biogenesis protein CcmH
MIYFWMLLVALASMLPLFLAFRKAGKMQGRRENALAIHRAQLDELANDLSDARITAGEYDGAKLEIERRVLKADTITEPQQDGNARLLLVATALLVPVMAFLLYLPGSTPNIPSEPHGQWVAHEKTEHAQAQILIAALRTKLSTLNPNSPEASEGQAYLAEALAEDAGQLTPEAVALFKQSIVNAPPNAPWLTLDQQRLAEAASALQ